MFLATLFAWLLLLSTLLVLGVMGLFVPSELPGAWSAWGKRLLGGGLLATAVGIFWGTLVWATQPENTRPPAPPPPPHLTQPLSVQNLCSS